VPEFDVSLLGAPEASYLRPLLYGLSGSPTGKKLLVDIPSQLAIKFQQRTDSLRCAFLSPIDFARHGGDYLIVPGVAVSSSTRSDTVQLFINQGVRNVETIAVDIRVTSEIILAKIILAEKFPNEPSVDKPPRFIPMLPHREEMLRKADAALVVNFHPHAQDQNEPFALDLVEEWSDLTGLPYVHGIWVGYDEDDPGNIVEELSRSRDRGVSDLRGVSRALATERAITEEMAAEYLSNFSYSLGEEEQQGFTEFVRFAYFHGVLPDVPDLNFFDELPPPPESVN
jgi:chorismate dehydratase